MFKWEITLEYLLNIVAKIHDEAEVTGNRQVGKQVAVRQLDAIERGGGSFHLCKKIKGRIIDRIFC